MGPEAAVTVAVSATAQARRLGPEESMTLSITFAICR
jgi:hypothetical protein